MTMTATPQPGNTPPRVRLNLAVDEPGASFVGAVVSRDGVPLRSQPFASGAATLVDDYEAPFGVPVTYTAEGSVLPPTAPDWTETWPDLSEWTGATGDWATAGGEASSSVADAAISRDASGTIQRVTVADPVLVRVELVNGADAVVCSLQVDASKVTLSASSTAQSTGGGSFSLLLSDGTVTASADDSSWSLSREYVGTPVKLRLVALGEAFVPGSPWPTSGGGSSVALDSSGNIYLADSANGRIRKFDAVGVPIASWSSPGLPPLGAIAVDAADAIYAIDASNLLVRKFDNAGTPITTWSVAFPSGGIAVDSSGNVYVARDYQNIDKYDSSGSLLTTWGAVGDTTGIAVDSSDDIYTLDYSNAMVRKFDNTGTALTTWSTVGLPRNIATSGSNVYVLAGNDVRKFDNSGTPDWTLPVSGIGGTPTAAAVFGSGSVVVAHATTSQARIFTPTPSSVGEVEVTPIASPQPWSAVAAATLSPDGAWLIHPSQPLLSRCIDDDVVHMEAGTRANVRSGARRTLHQPIGRRRSVAITSGPRDADNWTLVLICDSLQARDDIRYLLDDQTPLLLRVPPSPTQYDIPDGWYSVGTIDTARMSGIEWLEQRTLTLPMDPVDEPVVSAGSTWTWSDITLNFTDWADVMNSYDDWLDVLSGPPGP